MNKPANLELIDNDNPEWTDEMLRQSIRFDGLPVSLKEKLSGRGKQKAATKISTTVRFDADVIEAFKVNGKS
jgi:uncharacterized protein (DUF4415 family)